MDRTAKVTFVTLVGSVVNIILTVFKIFAGVLGRSTAMIADGIHSLSDLLSDIVVIVFVKISAKGRDKDHDYGHGKFETFATLIISLMLIVVAVNLMSGGINKIRQILDGGEVSSPGMIALWAAVASIVLKEILYRYTIIQGKALNSPMMIANAWHHRSDAFSSIGSLLAIGGAMLLGREWTVLDPIASCVIGVMIVVVAVKMAVPSLQELLDVSLPEDVERSIMETIVSVDGVKSAHGLKTRRNGTSVIMEAHIVVDPQISIFRAHEISTEVERAIRGKLGAQTQISLHIEPSADAE